MTTERREFNNEMAQTLGRLEGKLDEALKADRERLTKIESSQERQWWMSYVVTPFIIVAHATARKFGVQV